MIDKRHASSLKNEQIKILKMYTINIQIKSNRFLFLPKSERRQAGGLTFSLPVYYYGKSL